MSGAPNDLAEEAIAAVLLKSRDRDAVCTALVRLAGQALARLTSHDQAASVHARFARQHAMRAARCWRP
jgi:hypothetical protein